jgi:hypothetical protein
MTTTHTPVPETRDAALELLAALINHPEVDRADVFDALKAQQAQAIAADPNVIVPALNAASLEDAVATWRRADAVGVRVQACMLRARDALTDARGELSAGAADPKNAAEKLHAAALAMRRTARGFLAASRVLYAVAGVTPPEDTEGDEPNDKASDKAKAPEATQPTEAPTTPAPTEPGVEASQAPEKPAEAAAEKPAKAVAEKPAEAKAKAPGEKKPAAKKEAKAS